MNRQGCGVNLSGQFRLTLQGNFSTVPLVLRLAGSPDEQFRLVARPNLGSRLSAIIVFVVTFYDSRFTRFPSGR